MNRLTGTGPGVLRGSSGGLSQPLSLNIISPQSVHSEDKLSNNRSNVSGNTPESHDLLLHADRQEVRFYCSFCLHTLRTFTVKIQIKLKLYFRKKDLNI